VEVTTRRDGKPVRVIANGRRNSVVGRNYSVKTGGSHPWESRNELHDLWRAEVSTHVVEYRVQPHVLKFEIGGQRFRYTPDREDFLADNSTKIVEVKDVFEERDDPHYTMKLAHAETIYSALGWQFEIVQGAALRTTAEFATVEHIHAYRRTVVTTEDVFAVHDLFERVDAPVLSQLVSVLPFSANSLHVVCAMIVRRIVAIDLAVGLSPDAPVSLVA
jgi:hypothetical protein